MARWNADVQEHDGEGIEYVQAFTPEVYDDPVVREGINNGDYRPLYRAILEAAFEAEPRLQRGDAVEIRLA